MHARICKFASTALVLFAIGASACEDTHTAINPVVTRPSRFESRLVSVEPAAIAPEFISSSSCRTLPAFRTRFNLFVHAERELFLHRLGFAFQDRFGGRTVPTPVLTSITGGTMGRAVPLSPPTSPSVPIPGSLPFNGAIVSPPFSTVGLLLNFDCGIRADGTLLIDVETADRDGGTSVSQVAVSVGQSGS